MRKKEAAKSKIDKEQEDEDEQGQWEVVKGGVQAERPKMFQKDQEINTPVVMKKLAEITAVRGKKGTDRKEQIELLVELESIAKEHNLGAAVSVKIGFSIVAAIFDYSLKVHEVQKVQYWIRLLDKVNEMLGIAISSKENLTVRTLQLFKDYIEGNIHLFTKTVCLGIDLKIDENIAEDGEELEKGPFKVRGCLMTVFERLDEEFLKVLKVKYNCIEFV